jgi:hypothetical protein
MAFKIDAWRDLLADYAHCTRERGGDGADALLKSNASILQTVLMVVAFAIAVVPHFMGLREWAFWLSGCIVAVGVILR